MYTVQKYRFDVVREAGPLDERTTISNKQDVKSFCAKFLTDMPLEHVIVVALDTGNSIIGFQASEGAPNQCAIYPSNIFRFLLGCGASGFIVAHNHPGGSMNPSTADKQITKRLYDGGKILDIPILDHVIIADEKVVSLREWAWWPK